MSKHTPESWDRGYVIRIKEELNKGKQGPDVPIIGKLINIIDRLEAEKAELREALQKSENEIENAIIGLRTDPLAYVEAIKQRLEQVLTEVSAALAKTEPDETCDD